MRCFPRSGSRPQAVIAATGERPRLSLSLSLFLSFEPRSVPRGRGEREREGERWRGASPSRDAGKKHTSWAALHLGAYLSDLVRSRDPAAVTLFSRPTPRSVLSVRPHLPCYDAITCFFPLSAGVHWRKRSQVRRAVVCFGLTLADDGLICHGRTVAGGLGWASVGTRSRSSTSWEEKAAGWWWWWYASINEA
ncbi:hypothetical protein LX32DRAFT_376463 [Colletotrichum zoysiae]|uniref:Uncharacterized protein n=1 Tax=Colletotrichum zoysiae TaxID=1216348 RepID=A0AAD9HIV2_9PEZI|nr:hypothetical protein LX32DRAFT_376463 [Colletotrichum zoysiae]